MSKPKIDPATISSYNADKKTRKDWNGVNPITKVIPNKKKNPKTKHKGKEFDYD